MYPAPPPREESELWFEEEDHDDDDPEMQEAYAASRRSLVEDEIKRWEAVVAAAAAMPPPAPQLPLWPKNIDEEYIFRGSYESIMEAIDVSKPTVVKTFAQLIETGLITKIKNKIYRLHPDIISAKD